MNLLKCQYTWSPCSFCPIGEEFIQYRRGIETTGVASNRKSLRFNVIKQENRCRRLSSLFSPRNVQHADIHSEIEADNIPPVDYNLKSPETEIMLPNRKTRFVVTPCALEKN